MSDMLVRALKFAAKHHGGQLDKQGNPYMFHVLDVVHRVSGEAQQVVAALHDVVEDTYVTFNEIEHEFGEEVMKAVLAITRLENETYRQYLRRVKNNEIAYWVKLADMMSNYGRIDGLPDGKDKEYLEQKYRKAFAYLMSDEA